jgi:hypothetical protein
VQASRGPAPVHATAAQSPASRISDSATQSVTDKHQLLCTAGNLPAGSSGCSCNLGMLRMQDAHKQLQPAWSIYASGNGVCILYGHQRHCLPLLPQPVRCPLHAVGLACCRCTAISEYPCRSWQQV